MIQKPNLLACAASLPMNDVTPIFAGTGVPPATALEANAFENGCEMARDGVGVYVILVDAQQGTPLNMAVPVVTVLQPFGGPFHPIGVIVSHVSDAAGIDANQTGWEIITYLTTDVTAAPADFPGQLVVAIWAVGDPGGTGI